MDNLEEMNQELLNFLVAFILIIFIKNIFEPLMEK
jgi:hypothetical protein